MTGNRTHAPGSCRDLLERLSDYVDGDLPADLCGRIESHMEDCPPCKVFLESLERTVRLVEAMPAPSLPEELRRDLARLAQRIAGD